jgi:hypothetical protein
MPAPATIEIGANSNIPPRITQRLMGSQTLASQIPGIGAQSHGANTLIAQYPLLLRVMSDNVG